MKNTPVANRKKVVLVGNRNAGKSSIFNMLLGENKSIISDLAGTTTDPVSKAIELVDYGPISLVDTAGLDDIGELGNMRVEKSKKEISTSDLIIHVVSVEEIFDKEILDIYNLLTLNSVSLSDEECNKSMIQMLNLIKSKFESTYRTLLKEYNSKKKKFILVFNKVDLLSVKSENLYFDTFGWINEIRDEFLEEYENISFIDSINEEFSRRILEMHIGTILSSREEEIGLLEGLVNEGDHILLVVPIDSEAPAGRLILPQSQVIRDALDRGVFTSIVKDTELSSYLNKVNPNIDLIIIDSKIFENIKDIVPENVRLTSFSILFARQKGDLNEFIVGVESIRELKDGDRILISESCSHTTSHEDIGKFKIPSLLINKTKANLEFDFSNGRDFPDDLSEYTLVIQCGGCMTTRNDIMERIEIAKDNGVPITNYGILFSYLSGLLEKTKF